MLGFLIINIRVFIVFCCGLQVINFSSFVILQSLSDILIVHVGNTSIYFLHGVIN